MDDKTPRIDQLLCTHCTYGTSFLHQNTAHLKDQVFEFSARAGSVERTQCHDIFRRIEPFLNYRLPADAPHAALIENTAKTLPKRLVYLPVCNGLRMIAQLSYRKYDVTGRRAGAYFAHVLLESVGDTPRGPQGRPAQPLPPKPVVTWSARDAAQMWGWPDWIEEDDTEPGAKSLPPALAHFSKLPTPSAAPTGWLSVPEPQRVGDASLRAFLRADGSQPLAWLPSRWNSFDAGVRQKLLVEVLHIYLTKLNVAQRDCCLIGVEPEVAAHLFYGVARLLPRRGPAELLSFSTCEPQNLRPRFALAATHAFKYGPLTLTEDPRICTFALNTFQPGWEKAPRNPRNPEPGATSYARRMVDLFVNSGPQAVNDFLDPFDNEATHPQAPTANDLSDLLTAEAYGRWLIGAAPQAVVPPAPTSPVGKGQVAAILQSALGRAPGVRLENPAVWRPLLQILADEAFERACGTAASRAREDLVAKILLSVVGHAPELDSCLNDAALPPVLKARLLTRLIQDGKPLPVGEDDFWKGRFPSPSPSPGQQTWLSFVADRLVEKEGAAGLERLRKLYETWLNAQPQAAQVAVQQSRASVLQTLCDVVRKHPQAGATAAVQQLVDRFLRDTTHWHHDLLNTAHWSPVQCQALCSTYAERPQGTTAVPVGESPLAEWVRRDLETFPNPPLGVKNSPGLKPWLALLEAADRQLGLGCTGRIAAWKRLLELLTELPQHWAAKPDVWRARFEGPTWEARANQLGDQISRQAQIATHLEHCSETETKAALQRLGKLQQSVASSFSWDLGRIRDPLAAKFVGEVGRTLRELGHWNSKRAKILVPQFAIPVQVSPKLLAIAIGLCVMVPLAWFGWSTWQAHQRVEVATQNQKSNETAEDRGGNKKSTAETDNSPTGNAARPDEQLTKTDEATNPPPPFTTPATAPSAQNTMNEGETKSSSPSLSTAQTRILNELTDASNPHFLPITRMLISSPESKFADAFAASFKPEGFASIPSVSWVLLSPLGTPAQRLAKLTQSEWERTVRQHITSEGLFKLVLSNPSVAEAIRTAILQMQPPTSEEGRTILADRLINELQGPLRGSFQTTLNESADKNVFLTAVFRSIVDYWKLERKNSPGLRDIFDPQLNTSSDRHGTITDLPALSGRLLTLLAKDVTAAEANSLRHLASVRDDFHKSPTITFNELKPTGVLAVDCAVSVDCIAVHGIEQVNDCLRRLPSNPGKLQPPVWTVANVPTVGTVTIQFTPTNQQAVPALTITLDKSKPSRIEVSISPGLAQWLPQHLWLQMLVVEVGGIITNSSGTVESKVSLVALYKPAPVPVNVVKAGETIHELPAATDCTSQFVVNQDIWFREDAFSLKLANADQNIDMTEMAGVSDESKGLCKIWSVDGVLPQRSFTCEQYESNCKKFLDDKILKDHPVLKKYHDAMEKFRVPDSGEKKPAIPEFSQALKLVDARTVRVALTKSGHFVMPLDPVWAYYPIKEEMDALRGEGAERGDKSQGRLSVFLGRVEDALKVVNGMDDGAWDKAISRVCDSFNDEHIRYIRGRERAFAKERSKEWLEQLRTQISERQNAADVEYRTLVDMNRALLSAGPEIRKKNLRCRIAGHRRLKVAGFKEPIVVPLASDTLE